MKNSLKNLKLWQKKRGELPLSDDKHSDWLEMHALLEKHMPVVAPSEKSSWLRSKKIKTIGLTFLSFSAAAMVYVVSNVYHLKNTNHKNITHYRTKRHSQLNSDEKFAEKDSVDAADSSLKRDTANLLITTGLKSKIDSFPPSLPGIKIDSKYNDAKNGVTKINSATPAKNSPDSSVLTNAGNTGANTSLNKRSDYSSSPTNSNEKSGAVNNNNEDNTRAKVANNNKFANKNATDKIAHSNNSGTKNPIKKRTDKNVTHDDIADASADGTETTKKPASNNLISNNKAHSSTAASNLSIPGKAGKNTMFAKTRRGNKNKITANNIGGSKIAIGAVGSNFGRRHRQSNFNNSVFSGGQSSGTVISHRIRHNKKQDEREAEDETKDESENAALTEISPKINFEAANTSINDVKLPLINRPGIQKPAPGISKGNKKTTGNEKVEKTKGQSAGSSIFLNMDWGLLAGVNASGSFTPKIQNSNFYGSAPVDLFFGAFASYNINAKWAIYSKIKVLSPQSISNSYMHATNGAIDSPKTLQITSARKIYSLEVPLQLSYRINNYVSIMAGPLIGFPVKQAGVTNNLLTGGLKKDSAYFVRVADTLSSTKYQQKLNFGLSGGLNFQYKRLSFGAMWNQNLSGYEINSAFGTYKSTPGTFQFTIGWQLDKLKLK